VCDEGPKKPYVPFLFNVRLVLLLAFPSLLREVDLAPPSGMVAVNRCTLPPSGIPSYVAPFLAPPAPCSAPRALSRFRDRARVSNAAS
jgi:hypothetical protein